LEICEPIGNEIDFVSKLEKKIQLKRFEEKKVAGFKTDKDPK
jgi:hypothetical protein